MPTSSEALPLRVTLTALPALPRARPRSLCQSSRGLRVVVRDHAAGLRARELGPARCEQDDEALVRFDLGVAEHRTSIVWLTTPGSNVSVPPAAS